jgi:hypothetical protein
MMVRRDCPQGGVLFLWHMVINFLLVCLSNERAQVFADDIAIALNGKCLSRVCEFMQKALFMHCQY